MTAGVKLTPKAIDDNAPRPTTFGDLEAFMSSKPDETPLPESQNVDQPVDLKEYI